MKLEYFLALLLGLTLMTVTFGQHPVRRDGQAVSVLAQSMARMQGAARPPADLVVKGIVVQADGTVGEFTVLGKGRDRSLFSLNGVGEETVLVNRGGRGHRIVQGERQELPLWVTAYPGVDILPAVSRLTDFTRLDMNVLYVGLEEVDGRPAHHLRLSAASRENRPAELEEWMSEFHVFIDTETRLVSKTLSFIYSPEIIENRSPVETYFGDYRLVGGIELPHELTRYVSGQLDSEWTIDTIQFDVGLTDGHFE